MAVRQLRLLGWAVLVGGASLLCVGVALYFLSDDRDNGVLIFIAAGIQLLVGPQLILMARWAEKKAASNS